MCRGLSIKIGHTAVGWLLLVRHFLKCSTNRVVSGAKITNVSVGFLKALPIQFHQPLYQRWSIFSPTLVHEEITRILNELFIKTYCNARSSASNERFWPPAKSCRVRGENGFVFNFVLQFDPRFHIGRSEDPWQARLVNGDRKVQG